SSYLCFVAFLLCFTIAGPNRAFAEDLTIAAASDLVFAFQDIIAEFQKQTADVVRVSYGSSGNFFAQIKNGAPYEIFFSADVQYPQKLDAAGLIEAGSIYEYAAGKIVIWVPTPSTVNISRGLSALLDSRIHKIAI